MNLIWKNLNKDYYEMLTWCNFDLIAFKMFYILQLCGPILLNEFNKKTHFIAFSKNSVFEAKSNSPPVNIQPQNLKMDLFFC
jgi:hypothetical protein